MMCHYVFRRQILTLPNVTVLAPNQYFTNSNASTWQNRIWRKNPTTYTCAIVLDLTFKFANSRYHNNSLYKNGGHVRHCKTLLKVRVCQFRQVGENLIPYYRGTKPSQAKQSGSHNYYQNSFFIFYICKFPSKKLKSTLSYYFQIGYLKEPTDGVLRK